MVVKHDEDRQLAGTDNRLDEEREGGEVNLRV